MKVLKPEYFYEFQMKVTENTVETPEYRCIDEVMKYCDYVIM